LPHQVMLRIFDYFFLKFVKNYYYVLKILWKSGGCLDGGSENPEHLDRDDHHLDDEVSKKVNNDGDEAVCDAVALLEEKRPTSENKGVVW